MEQGKSRMGYGESGVWGVGDEILVWSGRKEQRLEGMGVNESISGARGSS